MNISGLLREYIINNLNEEKLLYHVSSCIEKQLKEWEPDSDIVLIRGAGEYIVLISYNRVVFEVKIPNWVIEAKKKRDLYSLDRYIWSELIRKRIDIKERTSYIDWILQSYQ
ncbi:hypothetical protein [Rossellomorea sp. BNER]|uniref:hypothetical protein n=1 Tax=Rossellomorea sp. BNER TaxID=2962031 RepID=UPI003AF297DF|nr:hypothetical protein [Rossellomorea sp. BNER]